MEIEPEPAAVRRGISAGEETKNFHGEKQKRDGGKIDIYQTARRYVMKGDFSPQWKKDAGRGNVSVIFVVDSSGSMAAGKQISHAKKIIGETTRKNRGKTARFAGVALCEDGAEVFSPSGTDTKKLTENLAKIKTGGRTNMSAGIKLAGKILRKEKSRKNASPAIYIFTDGRINFCDGEGDPFEDSVKKFKTLVGNSAETTVVDTEAGFVKIGAAAKFSEAIGAKYTKTVELRRQ